MVPRTVGVALHLVVVVVAAWLLLGGVERLNQWTGWQWEAGDFSRRFVLLLFGVILWCRLTLTSYWLLKRKFGWGELGGVAAACLVYQLGFALLGATEEAPLGVFDFFAIAIFLFGSWLNTWSEVQRKRFKDDPANQGKLYTEGFFRYARHINYFGDILWVSGWAMLTRNPWAAVIPLALTAGFVFVFIPDLSRHLKQKYGDQYDEWASRTKRLVPFVW